MPRALLSVSDKTGIVDLARGLAARGFELVSTGGTARALSDAGLPVIGVTDLTGFPEMMDGRLKTLHPALHGGILARRDHPGDLAAAAAHGIGLIDLVVVNLYPFAETAKNAEATFDQLIEHIQPALLPALTTTDGSGVGLAHPANLLGRPTIFQLPGVVGAPPGSAPRRSRRRRPGRRAAA